MININSAFKQNIHKFFKLIFIKVIVIFHSFLGKSLNVFKGLQKITMSV